MVIIEVGAGAFVQAAGGAACRAPPRAGPMPGGAAPTIAAETETLLPTMRPPD